MIKKDKDEFVYWNDEWNINKNKEQAEKYKKLGLTTKEIKDYMKGEDVILYKKDFKRLKVSQK